ncbi:MAG: hypothetical protein KC457_06625 [Myxococcales bacterium]|nr:hypothetical protein [Myxococcales bacterium]
MAAAAHLQPAEAVDDLLRQRHRQLAHRWLPLLLRRAGVANRCASLLQDADVGTGELLLRLKIVRDASLLSAASAWTKQERQIAELAESAAAITGHLVLGLELMEQDPDAARHCIERAGDQLTSLLVVGSGNQPFGSQIHEDTRAVATPSLWARVRGWFAGRKISALPAAH